MEALYTIDKLKKKNLIIFEAVMGSHAYGTSTPVSDVDLRGVFIQTLFDILKHGYVDQVADDKNDIVYYELRRFLNLTLKNNPAVIELLFAPTDCININTEEWKLISENKDKFLSKICRHSFAGYAIDQIKKARGYNKKMNWEENEMKRKNVLDFCYILDDGGSKPFKEWVKDFSEFSYWAEDIEHREYTQKDFGLANIDHAHDLYAMYLIPNEKHKGIVKDENIANQVQLCSIPKGLKPVGYLSYNKDAYTVHCKKYKEYQTWLNERNEDRFKMNKEHGKNYDSKNMMHTFRLLNVAIEIGEKQELNVRRSEEEIKTLMQIRRGEYEYDDLLRDAEAMISKLDEVFDKSTLREKVDHEFIKELTLKVRRKHYGI